MGRSRFQIGLIVPPMLWIQTNAATQWRSVSCFRVTDRAAVPCRAIMTPDPPSSSHSCLRTSIMHSDIIPPQISAFDLIGLSDPWCNKIIQSKPFDPRPDYVADFFPVCLRLSQYPRYICEDDGLIQGLGKLCGLILKHNGCCQGMDGARSPSCLFSCGLFICLVRHIKLCNLLTTGYCLLL